MLQFALDNHTLFSETVIELAAEGDKTFLFSIRDHRTAGRKVYIYFCNFQKTLDYFGLITCQSYIFLLWCCLYLFGSFRTENKDGESKFLSNEGYANT